MNLIHHECLTVENQASLQRSTIMNSNYNIINLGNLYYFDTNIRNLDKILLWKSDMLMYTFEKNLLGYIGGNEHINTPIFFA